MSDRCQRCDEDGQDRRTLWMACFYDMAELPIPWTQRQIHGTVARPTGTWKTIFQNLKVPEFEEHKGEPGNHNFFTLTVCKECRADWIESIQKWFEDKPIYETYTERVRVKK